MDPKDKVVSEQVATRYMNNQWQVSAGPKSGYIAVKVRIRTYADGRIVQEALNDDDTVLSQVGSVEYDPDQQKVWQAQQSQTNQSERKVARTYTGTDPNTGRPATITEYESGPPKYEEIKPAASTANPGQVQGVSNTPTIQTQQPDGTWKTSPNPSYVPPAAAQSPIVSRRTEKDETTGRTVTVNTHADGSETRDETQVIAKPTLGQHGAKKSISTVKREGQTIRITKYEDDFVEEETLTEETGADEPPGAPPLDLTPGNGMTSLVTYKSWLAGQAGLTTAQRAALLTERIKLVKAAAEESAGVAGISVQIMGEQGAEARSERAQANTRLSESQGTYRSALDFFMKTGPMMGRNGPKGADVMNALLGRAKQFAQEMGGTVNTPRNPVPTQAAPYYTVPGQAPAGGIAPAPAAPMPAAPTPAPAAPPVAPVAPTPGAPLQPAPAGPQPLYAPPASMQAGPAPGPTAEMPTQQPGGQFAEMVEMMRRAGLDPAAIDMANNVAITSMLSGTW